MTFELFKHKALKLLRNPAILLDKLFYLINDKLPDKTFIIVKYWLRNKSWLNLKKPRTFNEKMQWLKLYGHRPEYTIMADKYRVKNYVTERIGSEYVIPCLGVWENASDINFDILPSQFVLKCNHDSGGVFVCKDKKDFDIEKVKEQLQKNLNVNYFSSGRDKQYRDIERLVFAEAYIDDGRQGELQDYKFWCFNGVPKYMYITNKGSKIFENFYDMDFNVVDIKHGSERRIPEYTVPAEFEQMKSLATRLSTGIPFVRIDFYDVNGHIYFGEYTFFDWGGFKAFGDNWDTELGKLIII